MSDFENIPAELRERAQWLLWDSDSDSPRRPHWRGNFGVSWNDPGDWHSFEEAIEAASERESWGIGYIFAESNDDYPRGLYGGIDIDGCADPDTGPKEWLPSMQPFFDRGAYMEKSPSEEGVHVPLAGFEPPEWWSDAHFTDDEHEGVEAYGSKFFTFTGDVLGDNEGVADTGEWVEDWLAKAYEVITGEDPRAEADSEAQSGGKDAGNYVAGGSSAGNLGIYDVLSRSEYPAGENAAHPFHPSGTGKNFKVMPDGESWRCWRHDTGGYAIALVGQQAGLMDCGDNFEDLSPAEQREVYDEARERGYDVPEPSSSGPSGDGSERIEDGDGKERELPTPDGLSLYDGGYGYWKSHDDEPDEWIGLTNFQLETNSFATDPDDPNKKQIDMTVHPAKGDTYDVVIPPTVFNEKRDFKSNVVIGLTTTFSGKESVLNRLKTFVGTQDAPLRTGTYQMGRFGGEWVTPEGVLTADGWSDDPDHIHVSREIGAERKWNLSPEDGDEYDPGEVRRILELLPETRDMERFIPVLGWFYATPFKPLIHEWTGQFNLLGVLGETGAGKSATLSVLWELFGMGGDPMTADDTKYVLLTTLASTNSIPMWFDEYKPSDMSDYKVDTFWNEIRKTTRGGVSSRGNADGSTTEYHLSAPAVVSGEERVHGSAEERRGIYTTFKKSPTDPGSESARAFADLVGGSAKTNGSREYFDGHALSDHALAYHQWALGLDESEVQDAWRNAAKRVSELLAENDIDGLEELVEQGLQTVKFGATLYRGFADTMGVGDDILTNDEIDDAILYVATNAIGGENRKSHLDVLFEVAGRAARHGYLEEGTHYKFVREGQADEELRLNLATGFDKIVRYAREHDVAEDLLNSKDDYRERIGDAIEDDDGYVGKQSQKTPPIGRAVGVYVRLATEAIDGFDKGLFTEDTDEKAEAEVQERLEREQATEPTPSPVGDLGAGYQTLTVECVSRASDTPDMFSEMGVLRDGTGTVDYVVWDRADPIGLEEGETYRIEDAKVGTDPDGATQVELDGQIASVESISAGVGYLNLRDPGANERLDAAADGGASEYDQAKPRMRELLEEHGPCSKAEWMAKAQQAGIERGDAEGGFESLKRQGEVSNLNDEWEVV